MMPRVALLQLVLAILCSTGYFRAAASAVPPCSSQVLQGNGIIPVDLSCAWPSSPPAPSQSSVQLHGDSPGLFPTISLKPASNAAQATQGAGKCMFASGSHTQQLQTRSSRRSLRPTAASLPHALACCGNIKLHAFLPSCCRLSCRV